jgi:hypothetical protein
VDLRDRLLHRGYGVPCVGARYADAGHSRPRQGSKHLTFCSAMLTTFPRPERRTHLDGLARLGSSGLSWFGLGLGFHAGWWVDGLVG